MGCGESTWLRRYCRGRRDEYIVGNIEMIRSMDLVFLPPKTLVDIVERADIKFVNLNIPTGPEKAPGGHRSSGGKKRKIKMTGWCLYSGRS